METKQTQNNVSKKGQCNGEIENWRMRNNWTRKWKKKKGSWSTNGAEEKKLTNILTYIQK